MPLIGSIGRILQRAARGRDLEALRRRVDGLRDRVGHPGARPDGVTGASGSGLGEGTGEAAEAPPAPGAGEVGRFHGDLNLARALEMHPDAPAVFARHGLVACHRCALCDDETIGEGALNHAVDVVPLLAELNSLP